MLENSKNISTLGGTHDGAKRQRSTKKVKDDDDEGKKKRVERSRANSLENRTFARISSAAPINIIMTDHDWEAAVWQQKSASKKRRANYARRNIHTCSLSVDWWKQWMLPPSQQNRSSSFFLKSANVHLILLISSSSHLRAAARVRKKHGEFFACSLCRIVIHSWEHRNVMCSAHLHNLFD